MAKEIDVLSLIDFFQKRKCAGVVSMIHFLASPKAEGLLEIGSATMDLDNLLSNPELSEDEKLSALMFRTYTFRLGSGDGSVTPLQSMEELATFFDRIPEPRKSRLDQALGELAAIASYEPKDLPDEERASTATIN